jgi:ADP-L-glycero-D-manno-heptose 6-epimerase
MESDGYTIVTGGAGFIGSAVVRELNQRNITNIVVVDDLGCSEKWKNLVGKHFSELLHKDSLFEWLENEPLIASIVHLGACANTLEKDANYLLENNYRYSRKLAEYAIPRNIRFLYASSAATYGNGEHGFSDNVNLETLRPLNMYGYSKHLFDLWLQRSGLLSQTIGLKYFNVFGPNEWHKGRMASAIISMVDQVRKNGSIKIFRSNHPSFADGEQCRDFIYVKDVARITCDLLFSQYSGIFNVGTGKASTWNQLSNAVFSALKKESCIEYIPMPDDLVRTYQNFTQAETTKLSNAVSNTIQFSLEEAVYDYVTNYLVGEQRW